MNKNIKKVFRGYSYSVRTSGEVNTIFRDGVKVICKLKLFIGANVKIFLNHPTLF
jgi:hypothetical protein